MHPFVVWLVLCVYPKVSGVGLDQKSYGHHSSLGCRNHTRVLTIVLWKNLGRFYAVLRSFWGFYAL